VFILRLVNDRRLVGELANSRLYNALGWGTFALVTLADVAYLASQVLPLVGIALKDARPARARQSKSEARYPRTILVALPRRPFAPPVP
jgi:hypothetical protein